MILFKYSHIFVSYFLINRDSFRQTICLSHSSPLSLSLSHTLFISKSSVSTDWSLIMFSVRNSLNVFSLVLYLYKLKTSINILYILLKLRLQQQYNNNNYILLLLQLLHTHTHPNLTHMKQQQHLLFIKCTT